MLLEKTFYKFKAIVLFLKEGGLVNVQSYFSYFIVISFKVNISEYRFG